MVKLECPLCKKSDYNRVLFESTIITKGRTHWPIFIVQCLKCGIFLQSPRPKMKEIWALYTQDYESYWGPLEAESDRLTRWVRRRHYAYRCRAVYAACPEGGWVLDLGCGTGGFIHQLQQNEEYEVVGVDISEYALTIALHQGNRMRVIRGELTELCFAKAKFDVVTAWEVLEHVENPEVALREIRRVLKQHGVLLLSTPNGKSWQARLWGKYWRGWDFPFHIHIFSRESLFKLLADSGFKVTKRLSFPTERYYFVESAKRWLRNCEGHFVWKIVEKILPLIGFVLWPVFRIMDITSLSSTIVIEARPASHLDLR